MIEIKGIPIIITHRQYKRGNIPLTLDNDIKRAIYLSLEQGITEGAITNTFKYVIGWWGIKNIHKNPLLIK